MTIVTGAYSAPTYLPIFSFTFALPVVMHIYYSPLTLSPVTSFHHTLFCWLPLYILFLKPFLLVPFTFISFMYPSSFSYIHIFRTSSHCFSPYLTLPYLIFPQVSSCSLYLDFIHVPFLFYHLYLHNVFTSFSSFPSLPFLFSFPQVYSVKRAQTAGGKWTSKISCPPVPWGDWLIIPSIHRFNHRFSHQLCHPFFLSSPSVIPLLLSFLDSFRSTL